jgi:hypothetical protein
MLCYGCIKGFSVVEVEEVVTELEDGGRQEGGKDLLVFFELGYDSIEPENFVCLI